ncbi:hypothetical protein [Thermomonospora cellulosilytica]|uniref:Uncharacterized protein n=1 Tax=Thermomonospora cellulosilytica TaxID=1411118 RepID=A0A7W3RAI7_9ACTN|nr:hypothetical protein [Thermomonospora cellulosilytica]MBA9005896.1 hypothetical protein [Thermomonospora cellulosilytica]
MDTDQERQEREHLAQAAATASPCEAIDADAFLDAIIAPTAAVDVLRGLAARLVAAGVLEIDPAARALHELARRDGRRLAAARGNAIRWAAQQHRRRY